MFERYTERAKRVLAFAKYEASQMGSDTMQTEHVLLGLMREAEDIILKLFNKWSVDPEEVRAEVEMMSTFQKRKSAPVEIAISREAQRVLSYAVEESHTLESQHVGTEHILLGLLREENSLAARILSQKGLRVLTLREDIVAFHRQRQNVREQEKARLALRELARPLGIESLGEWLTVDDVRLVAEAMGPLADDASLRLALLVDGDRVMVSTRADLPPTFGSWVEGLAEVSEVSADRGVMLFRTTSGHAAHLTWVSGVAFLLLVLADGADAGAVAATAAKVAQELRPIFERSGRP